MARIVIKESDLTTPIIAGNSSEVVYVPGFGTTNRSYLNASTAKAKGTPTLCRTVAEFNAYFGSIPAVFSQDQSYPEGFSNAATANAGVMIAANNVDPSYIYAKELINAGIPVLYERLNDLPGDSTASDSISVQQFYDTMVGTDDYDPLMNLNNINDFDIKYITTGGYPAFEYGYSLGAKASTNRLKVEIDSKTFVDKVDGETGEYPFTFSIVSATAEKTATSPAGLSSSVTVDSDTFVSVQPNSGDYVFQATVTGGETTWELVGIQQDVNLDTYGITITGSPSIETGNTITVTVTSAVGWLLKGESVSIDEYGITLPDIEGQPQSPQIGDVINVVVGAADNTSIVAKMLFVASSRGDCVALIDHTNNESRSLIAGNESSVYYAVSSSESKYRITSNGSYGAMFTPWYTPTFITSSRPSTNALINGVLASQIDWEPNAMPGSFGYLMALADSVRNNPSWYSVAGVTRGVVPNLVQLTTSTRLTNAIADSYQQDDAISINPITNIRPYGYTIWGNRTLKNNSVAGGLTATSFLNIRNLVSDIKKQAYVAAMTCLFEQNTDILWLNFKSIVEPILEQMTSYVHYLKPHQLLLKLFYCVYLSYQAIIQ